MILALLATGAGCFALGLVTAVLCLSAKEGDSIEEYEQAVAHWRRCSAL